MVPGMAGRITLADVAKRCGVGKSTVSRALNNDPACAETTRARVQEVARNLGYSPDPALSALVTHRVNKQRHATARFNLAIVSDRSTDTYVRTLWNSVEHEASELGYAVQWTTPETMDSPASTARVLEARGVRGIVWGWLSQERYLAEFPWDRFSHIGFLLPLVRPSITCVRDDAFRGVWDATEACFARGYRRPGLALMTKPGSINDRFQRAGWLISHAERGRAPVPIWRNINAESGTLAEWVRRQKLDIVIGSIDGVFWEMIRQGLTVPGDVDFLNLHHPTEHYPGFDCREKQIGRVLVATLDRQIRHNELGLLENPPTTLVRRRFAGWD